MEGTRAQIPQCLGRDYPAHPPVTVRVPGEGPLWPACPVPKPGAGPRMSSCLQSPPLVSLALALWGFCEHRGPFHLEIPREHRFRSLGMGPGLWALQGGGGRSWSQVPVRPVAWLAPGSWCVSR